MRRISARELATLLEDAAPRLIDVREPWEFEVCHIPGSINVPMGEVPGELAQFEHEGDTVVICHHGIRSANVIRFLEQQGVDSLLNLDGGVDAWARDVDPAMPVY